MIQLLFTRFDIDPNIMDSEGYTPIHISAQFAGPEIVQYLLNRDDVNITLTRKDQMSLYH